DADVATNFSPRSFSRTTLDQGSENGDTCRVASSGKQARVIPANGRSEEGLRHGKKLETAHRGRYKSATFRDSASELTSARLHRTMIVSLSSTKRWIAVRNPTVSPKCHIRA